MSAYIGPSELRRRFMAGLTVTYTNLLEDGSKFDVCCMPRWHLQRLQEIIDDTKPVGVEVVS